MKLNEIKCVTVIAPYHNAEIQAIIKRGKEKKKPLCLCVCVNHYNQHMNEWCRKILSFLCSYMGKIEDGNWII